MKQPLLYLLIFQLFLGCTVKAENETASAGKTILPNITAKEQATVMQAIFNRQARRSFSNDMLSQDEIGVCLWAGGGKTVDGVTGATRSYAAAGGIYPLEFYLVVENIENLKIGIYRYNWKDHSLSLMKPGSHMNTVSSATYSSSFKSGSTSACIIITAIPSRTSSKYGKRGSNRYVPMAVGASGQNISLQAEALGLATYVIGSFNDNKISKLLEISGTGEVPMYVMPIGKR